MGILPWLILAAAALLFVGLGLAESRGGYMIPASKPLGQLEPYRDMINTASVRHGIDGVLYAAVIWRESTGNPNVLHHDYDGAPPAAAQRAGWTAYYWGSSFGLAQVEGATAWAEGYRGSPAQLFDPKTNLDLGARVLAADLRSYSTVLEALLDYNGGPKAVEAYQKGSAYNLEYAREVLAIQASIQAGKGPPDG